MGGGTYSGDGESLTGVTAVKQNTTIQEASALQQLFPCGRNRFMVPAKLPCSMLEQTQLQFASRHTYLSVSGWGS